MASEIPIVDLAQSNTSEAFVDACHQLGFASIVGHGIDVAAFARMRTLLRRLFDLDPQIKKRHRIEPTNYRGFIPLGFFTPNRAEINGTAPDLYEGYKLHWECPADDPIGAECDLYGPNRWVSALPDMADIVLAYWAAAQATADRLLSLLAPALDVDITSLLSWHDHPLTNMTLLHYPAQTSTGDEAGIHAHKDTNVLTLLHPDPVGGLEVRDRNGSWLEADPPPDALIVNVGEMLELWSGGRLIATPHRVVNRSGQERYSFPFFTVPRHDVIVKPLKHCLDGFDRPDMAVGPLSAEVWRTNWADEPPSMVGHDLGALDR